MMIFLPLTSLKTTNMQAKHNQATEISEKVEECKREL